MKPVVTPRFALSCTGALLGQLGAIAKNNNLHIQVSLCLHFLNMSYSPWGIVVTETIYWVLLRMTEKQGRANLYLCLSLPINPMRPCLSFPDCVVLCSRILSCFDVFGFGFGFGLWILPAGFHLFAVLDYPVPNWGGGTLSFFPLITW